jgi:hypothetical protein
MNEPVQSDEPCVHREDVYEKQLGEDLCIAKPKMMHVLSLPFVASITVDSVTEAFR